MPVPRLVRGPPSAKAKSLTVAGRVQCATGVGRDRIVTTPRSLVGKCVVEHEQPTGVGFGRPYDGCKNSRSPAR